MTANHPAVFTAGKSARSIRPNKNRPFNPLFAAEVNTKQIFSTALIVFMRINFVN